MLDSVAARGFEDLMPNAREDKNSHFLFGPRPNARGGPNRICTETVKGPILRHRRSRSGSIYRYSIGLCPSLSVSGLSSMNNDEHKHPNCNNSAFKFFRTLVDHKNSKKIGKTFIN